MRPLPVSEIRKQVAVLGVAERIFDAAVLLGLFELGVFHALSSGAGTVAQLSAAVGADEDRLRVVLDAAVALHILSQDEAGRYVASDEVLDCLGRADAPTFMGEWITFLHVLSAPLLRLADATRNGGGVFDDMGIDDPAVKTMTLAMDSYARSRGIEIAERLPLGEARTMLDLGCGPATYSLAIAERNPDLRITLLDFPGPIEEARRIAAQHGMEERFEFVAADAFAFEAPAPFDVVLVSNTLHMLGPDKSQELLRRCLPMVVPGGRIVVQAMFLNEDRVSPRWPALLNVMQLVATPSGRNHTVGETVRWLETVGFVDAQHLPFSLWNVCSAVVARRPASEIG